jgi:polysaccharide biosynthesis transport protein
VGLRHQLQIARSWAWLLAVSTVLCAVVAFVVASQVPRTYSSQVSILIGPPLGGVVQNQDIQTGQALRQTYADLAATQPLLERVIAATGVKITPDTLAAAVTTLVPAGSNVLYVSVDDNNPQEAAALANGIATELSNYPAPTSKVQASPNVILTVIDPAVAATVPSSRGPLFSGLVGAVIGLMAAILLISLIETIRRESREALGQS